TNDASKSKNPMKKFIIPISDNSVPTKAAINVHQKRLHPKTFVKASPELYEDVIFVVHCIIITKISDMDGNPNIDKTSATFHGSSMLPTEAAVIPIIAAITVKTSRAGAIPNNPEKPTLESLF